MNLTLENIGFERNDSILFHSISHTLTRGSLLQINGMNGSGKSTLLRILAGFIEPTLGVISWNENSILKNLYAYQQNLYYLGHQNAIKPRLTSVENLQLSCKILGVKKDPKHLAEVLRKVGLEEHANTFPVHLSAGQCRRLSLARLFLTSASLWLLDEPATALDIKGQILLSEVLDHHVAGGGIVIVATHQDLLFQSRKKIIDLTRVGIQPC